MSSARQPTPAASWRIQHHCRNPRCAWQVVWRLTKQVRICASYQDAVAFIASQAPGPRR